MKIKKNDNVLVISGKYKGKTGKVVQVFPMKNKIIVEGVNVVKKAIKASKKYPKGGIVEILKPFPASKIKIICSSCQKATKIKFQFEQNKKYRLCQKCGAKIE